MFQFRKSASVLLWCAAAGLGAGPASAAGFLFECQVLDGKSQEVRTVFKPGDSMLVRYTLEVPPEAAEEQIDLKLSARAQVAGITIPYSLDELKLAVPNHNPAPSKNPQAVPQSGSRAGSSLVQIPADFPAGIYQVRAKASIEGVGKRTCELKVEITAAPAS